jgi:hypothetical protein
LCSVKDRRITVEHWWNNTGIGNPKYSKKGSASATISITNPTWNKMGSNAVLLEERTPTNCLIYGMALEILACLIL